MTPLWDIYVRAKCGRFQIYADGHIAPELHWLANDTIANSALTELGRERQSVRTGPDNYHIRIFDTHYFPSSSIVDFFFLGRPVCLTGAPMRPRPLSYNA